MGTVPILDFRGLLQSRAWGHGELGPPHPHPCRMEAGAGSDVPTMTEHGIYVPGHPFAIEMRLCVFLIIFAIDIYIYIDEIVGVSDHLLALLYRQS